MAKIKLSKDDSILDEMTAELLSSLPMELQKRYFEISKKILALPEETQEMVMELAFELTELQAAMMDYAASEMMGGKEDDEENEEDADYDEENYPQYLPATDVKKYTLRVELREAPVPVWRRIVVPSNISLRHLSELLLDLMGWGGGHLNQFMKGRRYFQPAYQLEDDSYYDVELQEKHTLAELVQKTGQCCTWEYDFGDSWRHDVKLSGVADYSEDEPRIIVFKAGSGCCPPEDCGGVWGYGDLLELHYKRKSKAQLSDEEKEQLEWYGIDKHYNPTSLDIDECEAIVEDYNTSMEL